VPGVFYAWEPIENFTAPWSRTTSFIPSENSNCVDAKLTIWTICGEKVVYPFSLNYFDGAPAIIGWDDVSSSSFGIAGQLNFENTETYTIEVVSNSNVVLHSEEFSAPCSSVQGVNFNFNCCEGNLCEPSTINIIANNPCYGTLTESIQ
jgi:hypothetical protein